MSFIAFFDSLVKLTTMYLVYYLYSLNTSPIHECSKAYTNDCHRLYADCINQVGGYMCHCKEGFYGDGLSCSGMLDIEA